MDQLKGLLSDKGILALNFVAFYDGGHNASLAAVSKTIEQSFKHQQFFISELGENFNDFIFLATKQPIDISNSALQASEKAWLEQRKLPLDNSKGIVLTDNLNPLEHLQTAKSEHYRHVVVEAFGPQLLVR